MSGAIKSARYGQQLRGRAMPGTGYAGDPGLFGFLGKAVKGVAGALIGGTPVGRIASTAIKVGKGIFGSKKSTVGRRMVQSQVMPQADIAQTPAALGRMMGRGVQGPVQLPGSRRLPPAMGIDPYRAAARMMGPDNQPKGSQQPVLFAGPGMACPSGYKPNKTGYWITSPMGTPSYVSPGERCVKIRKRNPLNPRAWDRAYSRLKSSKRWGKKLGSITMRDTCPHK